MKDDRQNAILEIIAATDVETQNQLIGELLKRGFASTQATVSRDIKELHIIKELTDSGTYRYAVPRHREVQNNSARLRTIFKESVLSISCAQNIVVLKTLPGLASAACSAIDGMDIRHLVGSIAGDDTAFLAMTNNAVAKDFCEEIETLLH